VGVGIGQIPLARSVCPTPTLTLIPTLTLAPTLSLAPTPTLTLTLTPIPKPRTILKAVCWRSSCVLGPHELRTMGSVVPSCSRGDQFQPSTHLG
jgi:hypothetical protein